MKGITKEALKEKHGQIVEDEILQSIKRHMHITNHSISKMSIREGGDKLLVTFKDGKTNYPATISRIGKAIDKNILAYYNTDGSVNIALDRWTYFVFEYDEAQRYWVLITFKEMSWYGKDIFEKQQMAVDGFDRKY